VIRPEVEVFLALGPLPPSSVDVLVIEIHQERLEKISAPVSDEEAALLVGMFGPDDCFGLAWRLVHLIETAPGCCPIKQKPTSADNEWVQSMWATYSREPLVDALRRWHSASRDRLAEIGITMTYLESPSLGNPTIAADRSALVDLTTELAIGRATVWNRGFCDLEVLAVPTGRQILGRRDENVSGIALWALLDELARRMTMR
jgi:hypothetical protein